MNKIKNDNMYRLSLDTLDALVFFTLSQTHELHNIEWDEIYETWKEIKLHMPLTL